MLDVQLHKSPGQIAYEEDVRRQPCYDDGSPRKTWMQLPPIMQWTWEKTPTPRARDSSQ